MQFQLTLMVTPSGPTRTLQFWSPSSGTLPSVSVPLVPGLMMMGAKNIQLIAIHVYKAIIGIISEGLLTRGKGLVMPKPEGRGVYFSLSISILIGILRIL